MKFLRPIRRFVLLVDEPKEIVKGGIIDISTGTDRLDYFVAAVGTEERDPGFGPGDRVLIDDPNIGRKVTIDGVPYRVVRTTNIIAVLS